MCLDRGPDVSAQGSSEYQGSSENEERLSEIENNE